MSSGMCALIDKMVDARYKYITVYCHLVFEKQSYSVVLINPLVRIISYQVSIFTCFFALLGMFIKIQILLPFLSDLLTYIRKTVQKMREREICENRCMIIHVKFSLSLQPLFVDFWSVGNCQFVAGISVIVVIISNL